MKGNAGEESFSLQLAVGAEDQLPILCKAPCAGITLIRFCGCNLSLREESTPETLK